MDRRILDAARKELEDDAKKQKDKQNKMLE